VLSWLHRKRWDLREYVSRLSLQGHLFKFLYRMLELPANHDLRSRLSDKRNGLEDMAAVVAELDQIRYADEASARRVTNGEVIAPVTWYRRHRAQITAKPAAPPLTRIQELYLLHQQRLATEGRSVEAKAVSDQCA
jgi:hypothetical protein